MRPIGVRLVRHDGFDVGLGGAVDDAAGQRHQRLDPAGGLFGQRGAGLVLRASRIAVPTAVRIEVMVAVMLSNSARILASANS